ncbi:uncharacterized protein GJ701_001666 isoform 2-T2 [Geothlypis trichas]
MRELPPDFYSYRFKPLVHPQSHKKIPRVGSSEVSLTKLPVEMPHINAAAALQVSMLLFALPAQYFISLWYGTDSAERIQITERNWYYEENKTKSSASEAKFHSYLAGIEVFAILSYFTYDAVYKASIVDFFT